jgi:hypothetical protein
MTFKRGLEQISSTKNGQKTSAEKWHFRARVKNDMKNDDKKRP